MESSSLRQFIRSRTHLYSAPDEKEYLKIEMLFGEPAELLDEQGDWSHVRTVLGGYEGYVEASALGPYEPHTHRVCERAAVLFKDAHYKNPAPDEPLYFNSLLTIEESKETPEGTIHKVKGSKWLFDTQICEKEYVAPDFVNECLKFLGTPYGYEKRGALIDCSTLVQAGCIAAGIDCPFDVKSGAMEELGEPLDFAADFSNLRRGDLVFWTKDKGSHVAIMVNGTECLHATIATPYRRALIQPLAEVIHDQARDHNGPVTKVRRFPHYLQ